MTTGIIAYGTQEDRDKLKALALTGDKSSSQVLIDLLRERYESVYNQTDPQRVIDMYK